MAQGDYHVRSFATIVEGSAWADKACKGARIFLTPRNALLKARLDNGAVVLGLNRPGHGGRGVYLYRDAIEPEFQHLAKFLRPGDVFIDIGANTGIYSSKAAKAIGSEGVAVAIEPTPEVFSVLVKSSIANRFTNFRARNLCCGNSTGVVNFYRNFNRPVTFSLLQRDPEAVPFSALCVRLDDLIVWEKLDRVDFIKIDVEGSEAEVIAGAADSIRRFRPILLAEVHINDVNLPAKDYCFFHAQGSPNKMFIPKESFAVDAARNLGWLEV